MKDFFVSYNSADKAWAEWIAWQLEQAGHPTVIQAWDFGAGGNFVLAMQQAASEAERTVIVLSPDWLSARFTWPEFSAAFAQDPTGEKRLVVPVRVRPCELTGLLRPHQQRRARPAGGLPAPLRLLPRGPAALRRHAVRPTRR